MGERIKVGEVDDGGTDYYVFRNPNSDRYLTALSPDKIPSLTITASQWFTLKNNDGKLLTMIQKEDGTHTLTVEDRAGKVGLSMPDSNQNMVLGLEDKDPDSDGTLISIQDELGTENVD